MKITMLLLTCLLVQVYASTYAQRISINRQNSTIHAVLEDIRRQAKYDFFYDMDLFSKAKPVSLQIRNAQVDRVLKALFAGKPYSYTIDNRLVVITEAESAASTSSEPTGDAVKGVRQQPGRISGKVLDDRGEPLPGASVKILQTGQALQSSVDGSYHFNIAPGTYTIEVSYVSFQTRRITEVEVKIGQSTRLNIVLTPVTNALSQVTVTGSFKKESTAGLYARQKNEAGISNGLSAEQIATLPDKNVGETLKRISGVSTNGNRQVVVRGIAERYNLAMMDGAILPSTDVQVRDFEFDIIPSNLIDNVVVSKTSTPDMSFGFGGGLVQVNTLAIPNENFTSFSFGSKYIKGSTGKDFLGYGRGKHDYLGFDDGTRDHFPKELLLFDGRNYNPANPNAAPPADVTPITPAMIAEQNKKIGGLERMGTRVYQTMPGQNYQFSLGRSYNLKNSRLGFVGSVSYRNEQNIDYISQYERGVWQKIENYTYDVETGEQVNPTSANQYNFNTTWATLLNAGWSSKNHKITSRNFYSRLFSNQFSRIVGFGNDIGYENNKPAIREYDRPKFIDLLQNRINGEHRFGKLKLEWNVAQNKLVNLEQDAVEAWLAPTVTLNETVYNIIPSGITNPGLGTFNRSEYRYEETNRIAEGSLSYPFQLIGQKQTAKAGFQYLERKGIMDWTVLPIGAVNTVNSVYPYVPVQEWGQYLDFDDPQNDLMYYPALFSKAGYEGKNTNKAWFAMMDNRLASWMRLVWGIRGEYYKYDRLRSGANDIQIDQLIKRDESRQFVDPQTGKIVSPFADPTNEEKTWRYLPSVSLTLTPVKDFNVRGAYSQSVVRPALIENSRMIRFDPVVGGFRQNQGVLSTLINHYDFRLEWYPKAGEIISAGFFYKYFDKPVELYRTPVGADFRVYLNTQNSDWAKVHGWEFDVRKSIGFIYSGWKPLDNIYVNANLTLQTSEVQASRYEGKNIGQDKYGKNYEYRTKVLLKEKRPLFGQVPVLYNLGLQYAGDRLGASIALNYMGYKTFTTGTVPEVVEYERPRSQADAQLSYKFLKSKKLQARFNMSNITNSPFRFFINDNVTYKVQDRWAGLAESAIPAQTWDEKYEWKYGFSQKYEEGYYETSADGKTKTRVGDRDTFLRKIGSSFSLNVSYNF
ncbi:TonB-dependent receptor [Pararcticibacter amylolyticus]|uniref:TonB-dependent receptor n=2 Tax=Pararcticibacter amylolyticus TaxID=2173175 RepID=A0A2U2PKJ5_9SPHI|nr:TonB-dependent receptor [Pararcticibacter amylolyticus]